MILAIIPARGGSKRIPGKNIKSFCGKPIIAYSIECALESELFDRVIVSTDSDEIAAVAAEYGAETPFRRPPELADDFTPTIPVIKHAIESIEAKSNSTETAPVTSETLSEVSYACCIYPTAPFLQATDLQTAFQQLQSDDSADFCFPVTSFAFPIWRSVRVSEQNRVEMFWPENGNKRSQDLEEAFHDAGQFYWGTNQAWKNATNIFNATSQAIVIPRQRVQDIDTMEDWHRAEAMWRATSGEKREARSE